MLMGTTNAGVVANLTYQIADVSRPFTAVRPLCDRSNVGMFGSQGGYIMNVATGIVTGFERKGGIYELELWLKEEDVSESKPATGFQRQG